LYQVEYWVWLQGAVGYGSSKPVLLLKSFGSIEKVYEATYDDYKYIPKITKREIDGLCNKSLDASKKIIESCLASGYKIIKFQDETYPAQLKNIYAPPCVLYVWGELESFCDSLLIAIVGTRQITEYGFEAATKLAMGLARSGAVVVSGLALGVDGTAHKGSLKANGKTIAVIGCGLDYAYPTTHIELKRLISKNGAVVSEYPPGIRPDKFTFPMRNRIIAGLSQGTVVVEAGKKSGALITAAYAAESDRDVFAVPGSIFNPMSEGTNKLIRDGAKPVCSSLDILEEYMYMFPHNINFNEDNNEKVEIESDQSEFKKLIAKKAIVKSKQQEEQQTIQFKIPVGLSDTQEQVYELLSNSPVHVDELSIKANLELRVVLAVLTALEIQGLARSYPGRRFTRI
jgi:DNA processing protein